MAQPEGGPTMTPGVVTENIWTPAWVQGITRGQWLSPPTDSNQTLTGLGIDSRTLKPGQAFLAVRGEQFDGHEFIRKAVDAGASIAIAENFKDVDVQQSTGLLQVDDAVGALQQLARAYRDALRDASCHVIAVAGSNGKTTTRHLIHAVLSSTFKGTQSPKSFNNHLGVPLTLLGASLDDDFLVAEVGTNHPGEIDALGAILKPDSAVITCIGKEHMEFFGDLNGVANEEAAITRHLPDGGTLFIESEAYQWVRDAASFNHKTRVVTYGGVNTGSTDQNEIGRQVLEVGGTTINLPLIAPHDRLNAMAATEVGKAMGVPDARIKSALEYVTPMPGRLEVKQLGPVTVIDDSYNANPDSTLAALQVLVNYKPETHGRRIAILGDMLELGDIAEASHREIGLALNSEIVSGSIQAAILIGPLMAWAHDELRRAHHVDNVTYHPEMLDADHASIVNLVQPRDTVLLKGSRGMELEALLPAIQNRFADQNLE